MRVVGTAGHVDHGKSALIKALTGRDPDRLAEEKRRGLTIDLGFGWTTLPSGREVGFVDVPGHERFVKNMLAGVGSIDASLLVVAANEGWMPQTQEHADILGLLGVSGALLVITKIDLVDEETADLAALEAAEALAGTALAGLPVVRTAPPQGVGVEAVRAALDELISRTAAPRDAGRPRLWVDRSFTISGAGTVVTGTLTGGTLRAGTDVEVFTASRSGEPYRARVRGMQSHERATESAEPGTRVALNLVGLERTDVRRGDMVGLPGQWRRTRHVHATLTVLPQAEPVGRRGAYKLYAGSGEHDVALRPIGADAVEPGAEGLVDAHLSAAVPLVAGDRFVIREVGRRRTVAGGRILDVAPALGPARRRVAALDARRRALDAGPAALVDAVLAHGTTLGARDASQLLGVESIPEGPRLGGDRVAADTIAALRAEASDLLAEYHAVHPARPGMPREELRERLRLARAAFDELVSTSEFRTENGSVRLATHAAHLGVAGDARWQALAERLRAAGRMPPSRTEVLADGGLDRDGLATLLRQGRLVDVGGMLYLPEVLDDVRDALRAFLEVRGQATASELRAVLGITRKWAIPLLEHLDRTGFTTRDGDVRRLR